MYIDWAHRFIPKTCAVCSFLVNPLFIFIVFTDTKLQLGHYKLLLLYFSIFNMTCTLCDVFVPVSIFDYRYAFTIFVVDGFFDTPSDLGRYFLAFRCSFITGTYAILHAHFAYRYMCLVCRPWLKANFLPYGLLYSIAYCAAHMTFWTFVAGYLSSGDQMERLLYLRDALKDAYGFDSFRMNIIVAQYKETDAAYVFYSWLGIGTLSALSLASVTVLVVLGWLTVSEIERQTVFMSVTIKRQQTQLIKALVVQTLTPTIASFSPCVFSWYQPVFGIDGCRWLQKESGIAMSTFPLLDPLAIIFFVPAFRDRLMDIVWWSRKERRTSMIQIIAASETV